MNSQTPKHSNSKDSKSDRLAQAAGGPARRGAPAAGTGAACTPCNGVSATALPANGRAFVLRIRLLGLSFLPSGLSAAFQL